MLKNSIKLFLFSISLVVATVCMASHHVEHKHGISKHKHINHNNKKQVKQSPRYPIQHWVTQQGSDVYFLPVSNLPIIDIQVGFAAGSARDEKLLGISTLTNSLLNEGTTKHTADQIAEGFDRLGAKYGNDTSRDIAVVSLRSLSDKKLLDNAVALFSEVLSQPKFAENDFQRERNNQIAAIQQELQSPTDIAFNRFYKTLYGKHPYATPVLGTINSLNQLSARHAREFYEKYYTAQNATIAIVGNIDQADAEQLSNELTKHLIIGRKAPAYAEIKPLTDPISQTVVYPAKQTNILVGQLGIKRGSPDYFPLIVGNYSLGGGSQLSRLFDEVREKRGLSYSAYSQFIPLAATGPFIISLGTRTNQAQQALAVANEVFRRFIKSGPTANELAGSKKNINGSFALLLDSNQALANNILAIGFYDLSIDYLNTYQAKVNAVTQTQIRKAFQQHLDAEKLVTVQVGAEIKSATPTSPQPVHRTSRSPV